MPESFPVRLGRQFGSAVAVQDIEQSGASPCGSAGSLAGDCDKGVLLCRFGGIRACDRRERGALTNIIVVFRKSEDAGKIRALLQRNGCAVAAVCTTGAQALAQADALSGGIVVCGAQMADMPYTELRESLPSSFVLLLLAGRGQLPAYREAGVLPLAMPLKAHELAEAVTFLERELSRERRRRGVPPKKRTEAEEALLGRAKALLMERRGWSEEEAHRYLQKSSMEAGSSLTETARRVLTVFQ